MAQCVQNELSTAAEFWIFAKLVTIKALFHSHPSESSDNNPMPQEVWYVRDCSLFQRLSPQQLSELERHARVREFPRDSAIYLPSDMTDGAFLVGRGRVRICSNTLDGKKAILAFIDPGEIFGELALVQGGEREERAEAAIDSTVILLPGDELRRLMETSAALSLGVTKLIGLRRQRIESLV